MQVVGRDRGLEPLPFRPFEELRRVLQVAVDVERPLAGLEDALGDILLGQEPALALLALALLGLLEAAGLGELLVGDVVLLHVRPLVEALQLGDLGVQRFADIVGGVVLDRVLHLVDGRPELTAGSPCSWRNGSS